MKLVAHGGAKNEVETAYGVSNVRPYLFECGYQAVYQKTLGIIIYETFRNFTSSCVCNKKSLSRQQ